MKHQTGNKNYDYLDPNFETFNLDPQCSDNFQSIDPDCNFYNNVKIISKYYTESQMCGINKSNGLSLIPFNCRSRKTDFIAISDLIYRLNKTFDIIAMSETWLDSDDNLDEFSISGDEMGGQDRDSKKGGGVAPYIKHGLCFEIINKIKLSVENAFECISISLSLESQKTVLISCLNRLTDSGTQITINALEKLYSQTKITAYLLGDFKINLFNCDKHKGEFF